MHGCVPSKLTGVNRVLAGLQGMNELLAPLLYVFMNDPDPTLSLGAAAIRCEQRCNRAS